MKQRLGGTSAASTASRQKVPRRPGVGPAAAPCARWDIAVARAHGVLRRRREVPPRDDDFDVPRRYIKTVRTKRQQETASAPPFMGTHRGTAQGASNFARENGIDAGSAQGVETVSEFCRVFTAARSSGPQARLPHRSPRSETPKG